MSGVQHPNINLLKTWDIYSFMYSCLYVCMYYVYIYLFLWWAEESVARFLSMNFVGDNVMLHSLHSYIGRNGEKALESEVALGCSVAS